MFCDRDKSVNESFEDEHLGTSAEETPEPGPEAGIASIVNKLIIDEWEAIQGYNDAIVAAETEGYSDIANVLRDIANEENLHVGQLEQVMQQLSPNAESINQGEVEAEGQLDNNESSIVEESIHTLNEETTEEDPYGYGPYKTADDPTLKLGDYIKAKRLPSDTKWYPARVTEITPDFVGYEISGWGFVKNGTVLRSAKAKNAFNNLRKQLEPSKIIESVEHDFSDITNMSDAREILKKYGIDLIKEDDRNYILKKGDKKYTMYILDNPNEVRKDLERAVNKLM
jgi:rubrerythrin